MAIKVYFKRNLDTDIALKVKAEYYSNKKHGEVLKQIELLLTNNFTNFTNFTNQSKGFKILF